MRASELQLGRSGTESSMDLASVTDYDVPARGDSFSQISRLPALPQLLQEIVRPRPDFANQFSMERWLNLANHSTEKTEGLLSAA